MLVTFKVNLGSDDARILGVNAKQCQAGADVDVPDARTVQSKEGMVSPADWLIARGIAIPANKAPQDPLVQSARGVAKKGDACQSLPTDPPEDIDPPKVKGVAKNSELVAPAK